MDKEYAKKQRRKRREAGICTCCGKNPAADGFVTCGECRAAKESKNQQWRGKTRRAEEENMCRLLSYGQAPQIRAKGGNQKNGIQA